METPWHVNVNVIVVVIVIVIVIAIVNVARALQDLEIQLPLQLGTGQHATFNLRGDTNVRARCGAVDGYEATDHSPCGTPGDGTRQVEAAGSWHSELAPTRDVERTREGPPC
jgi:hypothetical protein